MSTLLMSNWIHGRTPSFKVLSALCELLLAGTRPAELLVSVNSTRLSLSLSQSFTCRPQSENRFVGPINNTRPYRSRRQPDALRCLNEVVLECFNHNPVSHLDKAPQPGRTCQPYQMPERMKCGS